MGKGMKAQCPAYTVSPNAACGQAKAVVNPAPSGGATITFTLFNGASPLGSNATGVFSSLGPNIQYTIQADIGEACGNSKVSADFTLSELTLTTKSDELCGALGTITAQGSGGKPPYTYSIDGVNFSANNVFSGLIPAFYSITVQDGNLCTSNQFVNLAPGPLTITPGTDLTICQGEAKKVATTSTGTSFSWTPATGLSDASIVNPVASPQVTTKYYINATLGACTLKDSVTVFVNPAPVADAGKDSTICFGKSVQLAGSGGGAYQWSPSTYLDNALIGNPIVMKPAQSITYRLKVTGSNGCPSLQQPTITITVNPSAPIFAGKDTAITLGLSLPLHAIDVDKVGLDQYTWSPADGLDNAFIPDPVTTPDRETTYTINATSPDGCEGVGHIQIRVFKGPQIYLPTAFTPNGDGHNDILRIIAVGVRDFKHFTVFNRYGQRVFHTTDPAVGWSGRVNGTMSEAGTFTWIAEGVDFNGILIQRQGIVVLIR